MNRMIAENIRILRENIDKVSTSAGISADKIELVAVSKTKPMKMILEAQEAGIIHFGENKVQELKRKMDEEETSVSWHFIGHLQTNKIKYILEKMKLIHSVDSLKLAEKISQMSMDIGKNTQVLLQVNTSGEESKFGFSREEVWKNLESLTALPNLELKGLMTMAPLTNDIKRISDCFSGLRVLAEKIKQQNILNAEMKYLSMGMSSDYEIAIKEGSNMLRIGTMIFGSRN